MKPSHSSIALIAAGACAIAAALALPVAAKPARACFFSSQISNWKEADDKTVNLRIGVREVYQLKLLGSCPDLRYAEAIGIETSSGSEHICSGLDVTLVIPRSVTQTGPRRCMATELRKLTAEEAKVLPKGHRP